MAFVTMSAGLWEEMKVRSRPAMPPEVLLVALTMKTMSAGLWGIIEARSRPAMPLDLSMEAMGNQDLVGGLVGLVEGTITASYGFGSIAGEEVGGMRISDDALDGTVVPNAAAPYQRQFVHGCGQQMVHAGVGLRQRWPGAGLAAGYGHQSDMRPHPATERAELRRHNSGSEQSSASRDSNHVAGDSPRRGRKQDMAIEWSPVPAIHAASGACHC